MSLVRSTATIGVYTLLSRVLGFVRDITIASSLGASYLSDAFFVAFKLPNYLRRLFAEGAFNSAFVPMYAGMLATEGKDKARQFSSEAMSFLTLILLVVTGLFIIFMPWVMQVLAFGFVKDPVKFTLAVTLTRITMPYILFISLVSLLGGVLNSVHKFAAAAAAPIIMNLCLIIIPFFIDPFTPTGAHSLAIAVMLSGIAQWLWLVWFCHKQGLLPKFLRPRLTADVKKLLVLIAPVALGAGVAQLNLFIDTIIATYFDSGVSYLYYADRINELPLAVIGIAVGTALLPLLSRQLREGKTEEARQSQNRAIALALFLSLPSAAALMVIAEPVISAMFERGAFGAVETAATYKALMAFAFGLPAFILIKILSPSFFANQDTKTPFKIALVCIFVNLVLNLILMMPLKHVGMALATSIAGWLNVLLMVIVLLRRDWMTIEANLIRQVLKIAFACAAMVTVLYVMQPHALLLMKEAGELWRFSVLLTLVSTGAFIYFLISFTLNIMNIRDTAKRWLRRKTL
jgi:putative peptidoglycan lipid II flippase